MPSFAFSEAGAEKPLEAQGDWKSRSEKRSHDLFENRRREDHQKGVSLSLSDYQDEKTSVHRGELVTSSVLAPSSNQRHTSRFKDRS